MVSTRALLLFSFSSLLSFVSADTRITSPAGGEVLPIGQPFVIKWDSDTPSASIGLAVCWNGANNCQDITTGRANTGSFTWTPKASLQPRDDYIILMTIGTTPLSFQNSPNFEIVAASSSTSAPASTSDSGPSSTGGPSATTTGPQPSGTSTPNTSSDSNNNGTIIGAAVGAVAGVVIIAVVLFIWMRKRNQKKLAEARRSMGQDDVEAGEKKKPNGSGSANGAAVLAGDKKKKPTDEDAFAPTGDKKHSGSSTNIAMAELPAVQQEVFEMAAVPAAGASASGGQHFFAMELDSREIPRPGTSTVKPDNDPTSKPSSPAAVVKPSNEGRGVSIDGTTVNSESERPTSMGSIEQIKESSREGSQRDLTQQHASSPRPSPPAQNTPGADSNGAGPSNRDSTPQIGSIPKLGGFDFDTAKF